MILETKELQKSYIQPGTTVEVLKGVDVKIDRGETVAILGQSGSGKSTLLALLAGLDAPTSGYVKIVGKDLSKLNERELAKFRAEHLGIVFQQFHLMSSLTALENVSLPLEIAGDKNATYAAKDALEKVGLAKRLHHFPSELSGGERQRVAVARAFVVQPALLLADEPSGNLDSDTGDYVMDLIFDLTREKQTTLVLVTHNRDLAKLCSRTLILQQGKLVEAQV